jgi:hypothetical protein
MLAKTEVKNLFLCAEPLIKKGATLGLSHGFLLGHLVRQPPIPLSNPAIPLFPQTIA